MNNKSKGFTLLEVMIAITIFAMLAGTLSQVTAISVDNQIHLEKKLIASWIAENKIIDMRSKGWDEIVNGSEDVKFSGREWLIKVKAKDKKKFGVIAIPLNVREVTVSVFLKHAPDNALQTFTAYMAKD